MTVLIPDAEAVVGRYLRTHPLIGAVGASVGPGVPERTAAPWVKLVQLSAPSDRDVEVDHIVRFMLQLDCYCGRAAQTARRDQATASLLARSVRAALTSMAGVHDGAATSNARIVSDARVPDTAFEPAMERRSITAIVVMHPD